MNRNEKCEQFILDSLRSSPCRLEAFDGREFNKQTVNASINDLLHSEEMHYNFDISFLSAWTPAVEESQAGGQKTELQTQENWQEGWSGF